jgi:IS1 family transposase
MNKLSTERRVAVVRCLIEGNSIRSTVRITGVAKNTVTKLLVDLGSACSDYQDKVLRNLKSERVQCDEIWSFVGCKEKNVPDEKKDNLGIGDVWTWTALDPDTKLMMSWCVGRRDVDSAYTFMQDVATRLANRVQLTTDGHRAYLNAVRDTFGDNIDYAMLVKLYGNNPNGERTYSPSTCMGAKKVTIKGAPDERHVSTSYVERSNLTMRMNMRRFTRLTNAFSKKLENHACAISLHFMYYNFGRVHQTLKTTPAVQAGITDHVWSLEDIIKLLDSN